MQSRQFLFFPLFLTFTASSVATPAAAPAQIDVPSDELADLQALLEVIDEETTLATKTRLNSDFVPGMVTLLQGRDMESLGARTVWDALSMVPGVQTIRRDTGEPFVAVRNLPFPFNSGNIKILVNSISMSRETSGMNSSILLMPIEQVERIEFMRGPGSSIYGNFAYMGLVNIVTRKTENRLANVSYANAWDTRGTAGREITPYGATDLLANFAIFFRPRQNLSFTAHWYHLGARQTEGPDTGGYDTLDLTANIFNAGIHGLSLRAGVKNALDDDISYVTVLPNRTLLHKYPGRYWWGQLSYQF